MGWSENGGPWSAATWTTATEARYVLRLDVPYRFRVRTVDAAGHWSPWVESASPTTIHPVDDRSTSIGRSGPWSRSSSSSAYRTTLTGSGAAGATLSLRFTGTGIAFVGPKSAQRGAVRVFIDGRYVAWINMKTGPLTPRQVAFRYDFPVAGTHTITVRVAGTTRYPVFRLDAFVVAK